MCRALPDVEDDIAAGRLAPMLDWLRTNIHAQGSKLGARDLLIQATGEPLNPEIFLTHLRTRYLGRD